MPPRERPTGRRSTFSLLSTPQPIPDDEEPASPDAEVPEPAPAAPEQATAAPEPVIAAAPEPAAPAQRAVDPPPAGPAERETAPARSGARNRIGGRRKRGAPETVRLRTEVGEQFWESFLAAKRDDPFLSVTDHASDLMVAGLDRERRSRAQHDK